MDFSVTVAICAHRDIKAAVWEKLWALGSCPNPKVTVRVVDGDALISRSRSRAASWFLKNTKDDFLMFIDDDIVISTEDATKLMWEAFKLDKPVIGAAYVTKSKQHPGFAIRPLAKDKLHFGQQGEIYEMRSISTGCMIIRRDVLEAFIKEGIAPLCRHGVTAYYPFFQHEKMVIDGVWEDVSEDWYFCEKARKLGFSVWCDTTVKLGHIGPYEYTWDDIVENTNGLRKSYENVDFTVGSANQDFLALPQEEQEAVPSVK